MSTIKIILLKLTGEILFDPIHHMLDSTLIRTIAKQIKTLNNSHYFGIVIGGGNFFRGTKHGTWLGINPSVGHQIGMLATMMNGLIVKDLFDQEGIPSSLFCAVPSPEVGVPISDQGIKAALSKGHCLIFSGGTGNPFFSTDTTSVVRALQIQAHEVWKGTNVDGIYTADPHKNPNAQLIPHISYDKVLMQNLGIMDGPAIALAKTHILPLRVFNIFKENALITAATDESFGSVVKPE